MNEETSWMKPAMMTRGRFKDCSWTVHKPSTTRYQTKSTKKHSQLSQLITGKSLLSGAQFNHSCFSRRRLSCMVSWPLATSFSGKTFKWLARPNLAQTQMNHFVGSYWYHLIALR